MSDDKSNTLLQQFQFPVAVFACLQAGSVFYLALYFNYLQEKYKIEDEIFDWFDFMLNGFSLFGILPGILLKWLSPKKTAILGGIFIVFGQMMTAVMVSTEHKEIAKNPVWMLGTICAVAGQGSCLVLYSCLQALMNLQTIQSTHVIATCCISYYLGADNFIVAVKSGLFAETTFTDYVMSLAIAAFVLTVINGVVITDVEDQGGFFGKAQALTKGLIYKKTNYFHMLILAVYSTFLLGAYFGGGARSSTSAIVMIILVFINLFVPVALIFMLDPSRIKDLVGEPSDIEKKLSNKGEDLSFSDAAIRIDFWYLSIVSMIVIGTSRMFDENCEALALHNEEKAEDLENTYGIFEVLGATLSGMLLTFFRSKLRSTSVIALLIVVAGLGQLAMIWPSSFTEYDPMMIAIATAAMAEGGLLVCLASFVHEEYGTENFGILFGTFMTFGAVGLYALDEIFFANINDWYAKENGSGVKYFKSYGDWNVFLFTCLAWSYFVCLLLALISHYSVVKREQAEGQKLVMVKF